MPSNSPAVLTSLMPGANVGGSSVAIPPAPGSLGSGSIGGNVNPFLPISSAGQSVAPMTTPSTATPTGSTFTPSGDTSGLGGSNLYNLLGGGPGSGVPGDTGQSLQGVIKGLEKTGIPGGLAALLAGFLQSGAGFNPQVAQALISAMQPQIERGTENIIEQFGATGNRFSSAAATGLGDYIAQTNAQIGQIFAQMYEQSVQNYLSILMGAGKSKPSFGQTFTQSLAGSLGQAVGSWAAPMSVPSGSTVF